MSSPLTAFESCSRLSAYLSWGCISMRSVYQAAQAVKQGIHFSQLQMQSGTTGINSLRIYNPVKQGQDHDPAGMFIRRWVPELKDVPDYGVHAPWKLSQVEQAAAGISLLPLRDYRLLSDRSTSYPQPVVDHLEAVRHARKIFAVVRRSDAQKKEARRVYLKHGSCNGSNGTRRESRNRDRRITGQDELQFSQSKNAPIESNQLTFDINPAP